MDDGAWALSTEYIPGITLGELFDKADEAETARLLDIFIDLQVKIMNTEAPTLLNKQRNKLAGMIGRVKEIDPSTRYDLQMRTDRMRGKHNICHGDFSPSNVIVGEDGNLYVCDWTHVTRGLDAADAATTYCILKSSRPALADAYLDAYSKKTDTPKQVIDYWVPVVAAAELARGREREHDNHRERGKPDVPVWQEARRAVDRIDDHNGFFAVAVCRERGQRGEKQQQQR